MAEYGYEPGPLKIISTLDKLTSCSAVIYLLKISPQEGFFLGTEGIATGTIVILLMAFFPLKPLNLMLWMRGRSIPVHLPSIL